MLDDYLFLFMYRTFVTRWNFFRVYPRVNMHLSTPKVEEISSKDSQQKKSGGANDEVKFDYINKTGIIQLNKPKTLNALSVSMIRQIYPKMKVCHCCVLQFVIDESFLGMGIRW
jgi:hypothetical protein